uniref:uncharacterized protein LOC101306489 isoform X2 n=1 Tax=Fragaria vesca subsp. vesca TaxID=101020 RepID=UPI0005C82097|nr:PREDICTED: uncharacterized protein LOC101306489 isoform X2 [Fragaria vesca subsp. vesca]
MESVKKQGSSSSSFTAELFGFKDSPPKSSTGIFASIFPPPSQVVGRNSSSSELTEYWRKQSLGNQAWNTKQAISSEDARYSLPNKERSSVLQHERAEPCHLSSSLYYGGQEVYSQSPSTPHASGSYPLFKKDAGEDDPNGSNANSAARGNWWEGIHITDETCTLVQSTATCCRVDQVMNFSGMCLQVHSIIRTLPSLAMNSSSIIKEFMRAWYFKYGEYVV